MFLVVLVEGGGFVLALDHFLVEKVLMLLVVRILTIVILLLVLAFVMVAVMGM